MTALLELAPTASSRLPATLTPAHLQRLADISAFPLSRIEAMLPRPLELADGWAVTEVYLPAGRARPVRALVLGHRDVQYCPTCLQHDAVPYFRKDWVLELAVACTTHGTALIDACPECAEPVVLDQLNPLVHELARCHHCGHDLRRAPTPPEVRSELAAFQRDLLALRASERALLGSVTRVTGAQKAALAQALFTLARRFLLIQYFDLEAWRLTDWREAQVITGRTERRVAAASLVAWVFESYPYRLRRLAHVANDPRAERHQDARRDATSFALLQLILRAGDGELAREFPAWLAALSRTVQAGAASAPFQLTDEQWAGAQGVLARVLTPRQGPPLTQPRVTVDQLLEYLASDRSWPRVANNGSAGGVLAARLKSWRVGGVIARLALFLHDDLVDRGGINLVRLVTAWDQGRDPFEGDWRSQTAALLLAPRMLDALRVDLPGLHATLVDAVLVARRRG